QQIEGAGGVAQPNAVLSCCGGEHADEARAAADRFDGETAPELEPAADLECLPAVDGNEAHALAAQPIEGWKTTFDQKLDEIGIGAMLRYSRHVVENLPGGGGAEIRALDFRRREIWHQRFDIVDAVIDDADRAGGETAIAAGLLLRRRFDHEHARATLPRRERRAERGIAGPHHDHIG